MAHRHDHNHSRPAADVSRAFVVGILLNLGFTAAEATFGVLSHSLALVSDAGHNLSDVLGLVLAWGAARLAAQPATTRHTYGFRRSTILASLTNAIVLLIVVGGLVWEAIGRFRSPQPVATGTVILVAAIGIVVNGVSALLFWSGRRHDLNLRGAYLHLMADAAVSLGVVVAGLAMRWSGLSWIDPAVAIGIAFIIAIGTWGLFRESLNLVLDAVPERIAAKDVAGYLGRVPGVESVHDLHVWAMSTSETALTVHLVIPEREVRDAELASIAEELRYRFGIGHATIQVERGDREGGCGQDPDCMPDAAGADRAGADRVAKE
jgi:cobalt-zinc-cadmium efflux system protein